MHPAGLVIASPAAVRNVSLSDREQSSSLLVAADTAPASGSVELRRRAVRARSHADYLLDAPAQDGLIQLVEELESVAGRLGIQEQAASSRR